jgi:Putative adhesin
MPTFDTPGPIAATVEVAGAQVQVTVSERTDTMVLVEPINTASRSDGAVTEKTKVDFAEGRLSVKTTKPGDKRGSVAITIELPAGSSLAAYLAHSSVQVDGPVGRCELHLASGQVRLDRVDALKANIASGEIAVGHIAGRADIEGGAFILRIGEVGDAVALSNIGGQVWIGHARADLDLGSASCEFDIDRADGSITANTASGAIRVGRMTHGRAKLISGSGNIEVGIGEGAAASLDVNSERGAVHSYVSSPGEPGASDPKVSVFARTRHGDIIIQRALRAGRHEASVTSTS